MSCTAQSKETKPIILSAAHKTYLKYRLSLRELLSWYIEIKTSKMEPPPHFPFSETSNNKSGEPSSLMPSLLYLQNWYWHSKQVGKSQYHTKGLLSNENTTVLCSRINWPFCTYPASLSDTQQLEDCPYITLLLWYFWFPLGLPERPHSRRKSGGLVPSSVVTACDKKTLHHFLQRGMG